MDIQVAKAFIMSHYRKNRTIVSADIAPLLDAAERASGLPMTRLRFRTGEEHGTWIVPPQWDVREAWLKDADGRVIASYQEHPLFVAPYSKPVRARVTHDELLAHVYSDPKEPDAFAYNWRLAYDPSQRLTDWCLSLPADRVAALGPGPFEVCIDARVSDGEMLIGEVTLPGQGPDTILFLTNYCHPGQVNDSFSGLVACMDVMRTLSRRPARRYTYRWLLLPETIGSAVYVASDPSRLARVRGAVFCEGVGWGERWVLKATRRGDTYMDLLADDCRHAFPGTDAAAFFDAIGNDELMFDSVQTGVPSLSLQKCPYAGYHTSNDEPSKLNDADVQRACDMLLHLVDTAEADRVEVFAHPVPFLMSRYRLFADDQGEPEQFTRNRAVVYDLLDGARSTLAIASALGAPFREIAAFCASMRGHGLVKDAGRLPWDQPADTIREAIGASRRAQGQGAVVWITGLSGAGKSTLGRLVAERLRSSGRGVVLLDGDGFRQAVGDGLGHDPAARLENARRLGRMCRLLAEQGIDVVCATMSLFDECSEWNRGHLPRYVEVFLDVPLPVLMARDEKQLYQRALRGELSNVVGVDLPFDRPRRPDLVLDNSGPADRLSHLAEQIAGRLAAGADRP